MSIYAFVDVVYAERAIWIEVSIRSNDWAIRRDNCLCIRDRASFWRGIGVVSPFLFDRVGTRFVFRAVRGASRLDILENIFVLANHDNMAPFVDRCGVMWEFSFRFIEFFLWDDHMERVSF